MQAEFKYLGECVSRIGRKDLRLLLLGTLVNLAVTCGLDKEIVKKLIELSWQGIKQLYVGLIG